MLIPPKSPNATRVCSRHSTIVISLACDSQDLHHTKSSIHHISQHPQPWVHCYSLDVFAAPLNAPCPWRANQQPTAAPLHIRLPSSVYCWFIAAAPPTTMDNKLTGAVEAPKTTARSPVIKHNSIQLLLLTQTAHFFQHLHILSLFSPLRVLYPRGGADSYTLPTLS